MTTMTPPTRRDRTYAAPALTLDWRDAAACREVDPELFFANGGDRKAQERDAKRVCASCPVQPQCLEWALANSQHIGVWGGMTEDERRGMARVRQPAMDRCLNRQAWIERQLQAGRSQKQIARQLGVDPKILGRAIKRFEEERAAGCAAKEVKAA